LIPAVHPNCVEPREALACGSKFHKFPQGPNVEFHMKENAKQVSDLVLVEQKLEFGSYCDLHPWDPTCGGSSGGGSGGGGGGDDTGWQ
jgi:hypothetical protein